MRLLYFSFLIFLFIGCEQPKYFEVKTEHESYKDFIIQNDMIVALGIDNELIAIDPDTKAITLISQDVVAMNSYENGLVYVNSLGQINFHNITKDISSQLLDGSDIAVFIQSIDDKLYIITKSGVFDVNSGKLFEFKDAPLNNEQIPVGNGIAPESFAVDNEDNIWVGFNYGEWGGELIVFNTKSRTYQPIELSDLDLNLSGIETITPTNSGVLISFGDGHGFHDGLIHFTNYKPDVIFHPKDSTIHFIHEGREAERWGSGMEVGPTTYNPMNNHIYFYSEGKIVSGELSSNVEGEAYWKENIDLFPYAEYGIGEVDTVFGDLRFYPKSMIRKLALIDSTRFAFLTSDDGIGIISKQSLIMYK